MLRKRMVLRSGCYPAREHQSSVLQQAEFAADGGD